MKSFIYSLLVSLLLCVSALGAPSRILLLDFWSPSCGPCMQMKPTIQAFEGAGYPIQEIDTSQDQQTTQQFGVSTIPCFVMTVDGQEVDRVIGFTSQDRLIAMFDKAKSAVTNGSGSSPQQAPPVGVQQQQQQQGPGIPQSRGWDPRIVQIYSPEPNKRFGTGFFVTIDGQTGYIMSCQHGLGAKGEKENITTSNGATYSATLVDFWGSDAAILKMDGNYQPAQSFELAGTEPKVGDTVQYQGFGQNLGTYHTAKATVQSYSGELGYATGTSPHQGDSGGPVVDSYGRVVGCVSGEEGGQLIFPRFVQLRVAIHKTLGLPPPAVVLVTTPRTSPPSLAVPQASAPRTLVAPASASGCNCDARLTALEQAFAGMKGNYLTKADLDSYVKKADFDTTTSGITNQLKDIPNKEEVLRGISTLEENTKIGNNDFKTQLLDKVKQDVAAVKDKIREDAKAEFSDLAAKAKDDVSNVVAGSKDAVVDAAKAKALEVATAYLPKLGLMSLLPGGAAVGVYLLGKAAKFGWNKFKDSHGAGVRDPQTFRQ